MRRTEEILKLQGQMRADAKLDASYCALLVVAAIVASLGLEQNSAATIIGAMVVAPLMLPIRALGFGLVRFERATLREALLTLLISIAAVIALGAVAGALSFRPEFGSEILARTGVTFLGLGVALAGGVLAALSRTQHDSKITDSLVGVGISVSLVPPLCTVGITLSQGAWHDSLGAMLLFLTNLVGISLACAAVFYFTGYAASQRWRTAAGFGVFALMVAAISPALGQAGYRARQLSNLQNFLSNNAPKYLSSVVGVESTTIDWNADPAEITTIVRSPRPPSKEAVRRLNDTVNERFKYGYRMTVVQDPAVTVTP